MFVGPVAGEPLIAVGVPIMHGEKLRYILGASISPSALSEILAQQRLPAGWIGVVFDSTGTIVARTHDPQRFVGQMGAPALVQRMREVGEDTLEITSVEGIRLLATFSKSSVSNFTVAQMKEVVEKLGASIATNQVEYHPFLSQKPVLDYVRAHNMFLTAYSPLARGKPLHIDRNRRCFAVGDIERLLPDDVVQEQRLRLFQRFGVVWLNDPGLPRSRQPVDARRRSRTEAERQHARALDDRQQTRALEI